MASFNIYWSKGRRNGGKLQICRCRCRCQSLVKSLTILTLPPCTLLVGFEIHCPLAIISGGTVSGLWQLYLLLLLLLLCMLLVCCEVRSFIRQGWFVHHLQLMLLKERNGKFLCPVYGNSFPFSISIGTRKIKTCSRVQNLIQNQDIN